MKWTPLKMYNYYTDQVDRCQQRAGALMGNFAAKEHIEQAVTAEEMNRWLMELWFDLIRRRNAEDYA